MRARRFVRAFGVALVVLAGPASGAYAASAEDDPPSPQALASARELYAAAEYEHALDALDRLRPAATGRDRADIEQYRAFCLMALGRRAEAEDAMAALVLADPRFTPEGSTVSPRVRSAFRDVRTRTLPVAIQRQYDAAKSAFDRREFAVAAVGFSGVLRLIDDPDVQEASATPPLSDLKKLAEGFRELSTSASAPAAPAPSSTPAVARPQLPLPPATPAVYSSADSEVKAPVALKQALPSFPAQLPAQNNAGMLELLIDERGFVESVAMRVAINPRYDRMVLDAARSWRYAPAMRNGVAVKYRKVVQIAVRQNQDVRR